MKHRIIRVVALALFGTAIAIMAGCGGPGDPCGQELLASKVLPNLDAGAGSEFVDLAISFISNGERVFKFYLGFQKNVCPDKHVRAQALAQVRKQPLQSIFVEGVVEWGGFPYGLPFEQRFPLDQREDVDGIFDEISGSTPKDGVGLKQVFGDEPAVYNVALEIRFNTLGDEARDQQYFRENVKEIGIFTTYREFRGNSSTNSPLVSP